MSEPRWVFIGPVDLGRLLGAGVPFGPRVVAWVCSPEARYALLGALAELSIAAWDGWGGEEARRKAAPIAYMPVEVDLDLPAGSWGFRWEIPDPTTPYDKKEAPK